MKKLVWAALAATVIAGFVADTASAAQRPRQRSAVEAPVRANDNFRNSYNAYERGYETRGYSGLVEGGAISAPAGR